MTPRQFAHDLDWAYRQLNTTARLNPHYLDQLFTVFIEIFINDFKPLKLPNTAYKLFLEACVRGLTDLTQKIDPRLLEQSPSLLTTPFILEDKYDILKPLTDHFRNRKLPLNWEDTGHFKAEPPDEDGYRHRSDYTRARNKYEKLFDQYYDIITGANAACLGTPLWNYSHRITPPLINIPYPFPAERRFLGGMWVCAVSGRGKTNLLRALILDDLKSTDASIVIIDSKGALLRSFRYLAPIKDRLVILDPTKPLKLNPLQIGKGIKNQELMGYLFGTMVPDGELTGLQETLFRNVLFLCNQIPNATIHTIRDIIFEGYEKYSDAVAKLDGDTQRWFKGHFYAPTYKLTKEQIGWQLENIVTNPFMKKLLSAPRNELNLEQLIDSGKVILVDNSRHKLGKAGAEFFGRLIIALIRNISDNRTGRGGHKHDCFVYIDEAQNVIHRDAHIEDINDECREQRIAFIYAHQRMSRMQQNVLDSLVNCGVKFLNVDQDMHNLATRFGVTKEMIDLETGKFLCVISRQPMGITATNS